MFLRKEIFILIGSILLNCSQLDATRIVHFTNSTQEPSLDDSKLDFSLIAADGTTFHLGTFKSSIDLDQYEISKKNPVRLVVKGINIPSIIASNKPVGTSDVLMQNVTYKIVSSRDDITAGVIYLFINLEPK